MRPQNDIPPTQRPASGWKIHPALLSWLLAGIYLLDRLLKFAAVVHFFRQPRPPAPPPDSSWPRISLLQPITRGASNLPAALACRAALVYPGAVQHILICDASDETNLTLCQQWLSAHPDLDAQLVQVAVQGQAIATKVEKQLAGLAQAEGEILCFVDDDINLRVDALARLVAYLRVPGAGAVFGLACYTDWSNAWSSLMSGFVNANALLNYIPLAYLTEPYTITGHVYALERTVFDAIGGLEGLDGRVDDDHELARRVRRAGLRCVQTPVVYDVENHLASASQYTNQMRRWFILPKQTMAPYLTPREQVLTLAASAGNLLLPLLAGLAVVSRAARWPFFAALAVFAAVYQLGEWRYLQRKTPRRRWPLVLVAGIVAPAQALAALLSGNEFIWRGRRIRLHKWGRIEVLDA